MRVLLRAEEGFWGNPVLSGLEEREITYAVGAPLIASVKQRISAVAAATATAASAAGSSPAWWGPWTSPR
ncbi:MAG: hypothetical protein ACRDL0_09950 [Thermoleophilaceae bacterium]